jgi:hypothetical protein
MRQPGYQDLLERSLSVNWRIDDLVGEGKGLDFERPFLPETFVRAGPLAFLSAHEKLKLNHVRSRGYLAMFELVETFVVPFVSDQAAERGGDDPCRGKALRQFVREENKHRELFRRVLAEFDDGFGVECGLIGPADAITAAVLAHGALAVTLFVLGLEWMSQDHYLGAVEDDAALDPWFKSLLKHHWMEEAQHAELDALMLAGMAASAEPGAIETAIDEYFEIGAFFDAGLKSQAELDLAAFERAARRSLAEAERAEFVAQQHQALRWTFLGSAMRNENFLAVLGRLPVDPRPRIAAAASAFA